MERTQSGSNCCACSALHGIEEQERERYCRTHGGGQECGLLRANNENEVMLGVCVCYYCSSAQVPYALLSASFQRQSLCSQSPTVKFNDSYQATLQRWV